MEKIKVCNEKCANYLLIKYEKLNTNNICNICVMKNSRGIKKLLKLNKKESEYKTRVEEVLYEV